MAGGLIRLYLEKRKYKTEKGKNDCVQSGVLYSSGLIAGEGIVGILLAVFAIIPFKDGSFGDFINISSKLDLGNIGGLVFFALLLLTMLKFTIWNKKLEK